MQFGIVDNKGKILAKKEKDFFTQDKENIEEVIEVTIEKFINQLLEENGYKIKDIEGIGIASPGTTDNQVIIKAENLGIVNFRIAHVLKRYYKDIKISVANDAKCAAMCEKQYGNLKKFDDCIFICLGTGVGGAVFLGGKMLKPKRYSGFELRTYDNRKKKWKKMYLWQ